MMKILIIILCFSHMFKADFIRFGNKDQGAKRMTVRLLRKEEKQSLFLHPLVFKGGIVC